MSFLKRAIRDAVSQGISKGIGDAVGKAVREVVEPRATEYANKAADRFDQAAGNAAQEARKTTSSLEGAFANLERSMQCYATQMGKNTKICPGCGQPTTAEKTFCPACGAKLPEQTVAEGAVCPSCGKQNTIGTKYCEDCGTKLPAAVAEEQAQRAKDEAELNQWDTMLPQYPKWTCGGSEYNLEEYDPGVIYFSAGYNGDTNAAHRALEQYRQILIADGFRPAGQYPSPGQLFKRIDGVVYNADTEHGFEGDPDRLSIGFCIREPHGGFDYVKPEPKKSRDIGLDDLKDLKKLFRR